MFSNALRQTLVGWRYESNENMTITCSTKVCSFGKQVVEKVETEYARFENGRFVYRIHRSPMCEYMINFIHKLKHLPEKYMMNSVLENFTILQVKNIRFRFIFTCFVLTSFVCCGFACASLPTRWWRIGTRKRRCSAWPTFSKCPRRSTAPSTTSTDWWKIDHVLLCSLCTEERERLFLRFRFVLYFSFLALRS